MGMFDRVIIKCPNCNEDLEFQSKAGECFLNDYNLKNIPWNISLDLNKKIILCPKCSKNIIFELINLPSKPKIKLKVTKNKSLYSGELIYKKLKN